MPASKTHLALAAAALALAASAAPAVSSAHADPLPSIGDADTFTSPWALAVERNGTLDVGDLGKGKVMNFSSAGTPIFTQSGVGSPTALAASPTTLYVADRAGGVVKAYPRAGGTVTTVGPTSPDLNGLAWAADRLYVAHDATLDAYDGSNAHVATIGGAGTSLGHFGGLAAVAASPSGDIYTAEKGNDRVQMFDWSLNFKGVFGYSGLAAGGFQSTAGDAVDPQTGEVYVSDRTAHRVQVFTADGAYEGVLGADTLKDPVGLAVDCRGTVYVADTVARRVLKFGAVAATVPGNLLVNPGFEQSGGTCSTEASPLEAGPGWKSSDTHVTTVHYGAQPSYAFPSRAVGDAVRGGESYLAGGLGTDPNAIVSQRVDVSGQALDVDDGRRRVTVSGLLGGHANLTDSASVDAVALDASGRELQTTTIGPVTPAERGNATGLLPRSASATLPRGTRAIDVRVHLRGGSGTYDQAIADNLGLTVTAQEPPAAPAAPGTRTTTPASPATTTAPASGGSATTSAPRTAPPLSVRVLNARTALRDHRLRVTVASATPGALRLSLRVRGTTAASATTRLTAATPRRTVTIALGAHARDRLRRSGVTLVATRAGAASVRRAVTLRH